MFQIHSYFSVADYDCYIDIISVEALTQESYGPSEIGLACAGVCRET
jgi:hypothetical protein